MNDDTFLILVILMFGVYILMRLTSIAQRARDNQLQEEAIRETVREHIRRKKLDELYGRDSE